MTYDKMREDYERMRDAEKAKIVAEWKAANGHDDLLAAYAESVAERLQLAQAMKAMFSRLDCGDNSCRFKARGPGGMRTNGGCRCFGDMRWSEINTLVAMVERLVRDETA